MVEEKMSMLKRAMGASQIPTEERKVIAELKAQRFEERNRMRLELAAAAAARHDNKAGFLNFPG